MDYIYLTKEGYANLKAELHELKTKGRAEAANAIAEAREKGDLSENAEYDAAKEAQGLLEKRISELDDSFARARVIDESKLDASKVVLLSKVEVKNLKLNKVFTYQIVAAPEADLKLNKISVESPIGKGLLAKVVGDIVAIQVPAGIIEFEILSISF
ncbi:MAG: transcription elongation factor GreA [Chitinophagales bacterium]|nr:transcription elongation factor GreA [Bacteroidota bacterium]MCB9256979.1 transcription elongation factor GreA [Chitinophagales bacterium]